MPTWASRAVLASGVLLVAGCASPTPSHFIIRDPHFPTVCANAIERHAPDARTVCEEGYELSRESEILVMLADLDVRDGDFERARERLRAGLRHDPGDESLRRVLDWLSQDGGQ